MCVQKGVRAGGAVRFTDLHAPPRKDSDWGSYYVEDASGEPTDHRRRKSPFDDFYLSKVCNYTVLASLPSFYIHFLRIGFVGTWMCGIKLPYVIRSTSTVSEIVRDYPRISVVLNSDAEGLYVSKIKAIRCWCFYFGWPHFSWSSSVKLLQVRPLTVVSQCASNKKYKLSSWNKREALLSGLVFPWWVYSATSPRRWMNVFQIKVNSCLEYMREEKLITFHSDC